MKNMTISTKLFVGFGIILFLLILSIVLSMVSITNVNSQVDLYGKFTVPNTTSLWSIRRNSVSAQRYVLIAIVATSIQETKDALAQADKDDKAALDAFEQYSHNQRNNSRDEKIKSVKAYLDDCTSYRKEIESLLENRTEENTQKAKVLLLNKYKPAFDEAAKILVDFSVEADDNAKVQNVDAQNAANMAWVLLLTVAVVSLLITAFVALAIRKSILNPVKEIENVYAKIEKGDMQAEITYDSKDEMGNLARSIKKTNAILASYIQDISNKLSQMSSGDMRVKVDMDYIGDFAAIKQAMQSMAAALNHTLLTIHTAAEQVSTGASQVASGAQALATGSTEQASSVEELSVSITRIAEQADENSRSVKMASQYVNQAGVNVKDGSEHMKQLTEAMANIGAASNQIANITKVIEDIAFQTNILALNAAIEAARAGNAGKGFAVVADEVRNLAAKSAEAAKQTADLIQRSVATVSEGTQITAQTAQILKNVEDKAKLVEESIIRIDHASSEQAIAIEQIKQGLTQVSSVVQTNAATAEENSATSEEMSAQAATLREEVGKFKLDSGYQKDSLSSISLLKEPLAANKNAVKSSTSSASFGKY